MKNFKGEIITGPRRLKKPEYGTGKIDTLGDPEVDWSFLSKEADVHGFDITNLESNGKYVIEIELPPGTIIIRYGRESGKYTAPEGTDYEKLAMPYVKETVPYYKYKVISKNVLVTCVVEKGKVAPGFDSDGGAIQYYHRLTIFQSVREGILERL